MLLPAAWVAGVCLLVSAATAPASWDARYAEATGLFQQQRWADAQPRLEALLADSRQPQQQALVHHLLGGLHHQNQDSARGEQHYRRALVAWGRETGRAATLLDLGYLLVSERRFEEAEPCLLQALALHARHLGPRDPKVGLVLGRLGELALARHDLISARPFFEEALQRLTNGNDRQAMLLNLARLHIFQADDGRALALLDEAGRTCATPLDCGGALAERGGLYRLRQDTARARPILERALAILGADQASASAVWFDLALLDLTEHKWHSASENFAHAEAIMRRTMPAGHLAFSILDFHRARLALGRYRFAQARDLITRALPAIEAGYPANHPDRLGAHLVAALAHAATGNDSTASGHATLARQHLDQTVLRRFFGDFRHAPAPESSRINRLLRSLK